MITLKDGLILTFLKRVFILLTPPLIGVEWVEAERRSGVAAALLGADLVEPFFGKVS